MNDIVDIDNIRVDVAKEFTFKQVDILKRDILNMCVCNEFDKFVDSLSKYKFVDSLVSDIIDRIIANGRIEFLRVILDDYDIGSKDVLDKLILAIKYRNLDIVRYILDTYDIEILSSYFYFTICINLAYNINSRDSVDIEIIDGILDILVDKIDNLYYDIMVYVHYSNIPYNISYRIFKNIDNCSIKFLNKYFNRIVILNDVDVYTEFLKKYDIDDNDYVGYIKSAIMNDSADVLRLLLNIDIELIGINVIFNVMNIYVDNVRALRVMFDDGRIFKYIVNNYDSCRVEFLGVLREYVGVDSYAELRSCLLFF